MEYWEEIVGYEGTETLAPRGAVAVLSLEAFKVRLDGASSTLE